MDQRRRYISIEILKIDVRKVLPYYAPFLLLTVGYVLFRKTPLGSEDWKVNLIACLQGMVVAWALFNDAAGTGAFIFSRPLSRKRLFLIRWGFGISLQLLTIVAVFVTIAIGLRSGIQMLMNSPYQPMVKWYELSVLGLIALYSILSYQIFMFLKLRLHIVSARPRAWRDLVGTWLVTWLVAHLCLRVLNVPIANGIQDYLMVVYVALVTILGTLASLYCYRHLEIET